MQRVTGALRDTWKVEWIAPAHCTGEPMFAALKQAFGSKYLYAGLGTTLAVGPTVKSMAGTGQPQTQAMDEDDLKTYRVLLAQSHDIHDEAGHKVTVAQGR